MRRKSIHRTISASVLFLILLLPSRAQQYQFDRYEAIVGVGTTTIFGDIGGLSTRAALSAGIRYTVQDRITVKGSLDLGWGYGTDKGSDNENRGYTYNTFLLEPSVQAEFHFYRTRGTGYNRKGYRLEVPRFTSYGFVGIGAVYFQPIPGGELEEDFTDDFRNIALAFPGGIGFQVGIARRLMIGIELGGRYIRTDYLDGYTSDNSKSLDVYYLALLNAAYRFHSFSFKRGFQ
jgi:hypothetical protein